MIQQTRSCSTLLGSFWPFWGRCLLLPRQIRPSLLPISKPTGLQVFQAVMLCQRLATCSSRHCSNLPPFWSMTMQRL